MRLCACACQTSTRPISYDLFCPVNPQLNCSRVLSPGEAQASQPPSDSPHWLLCAEDWLFPVADRPCVAYSFRCASMSLILCACACSCAVMFYVLASLAGLESLSPYHHIHSYMQLSTSHFCAPISLYIFLCFPLSL